MSRVQHHMIYTWVLQHSSTMYSQLALPLQKRVLLISYFIGWQIGTVNSYVLSEASNRSMKNCKHVVHLNRTNS
jgi:hypothetical protein